LVPFTETLPPLDLCAKKAWTKLQKRAASYAEEVRFLDRQIGRLVEALDATGRSDAKLIIAADHGESLVEHQFFTSHQHSLYDPVMRVPLIVRDLDCADCAGKRVSEAVSTVRVAATIRHLAGLPPDASIAGPSLLASSPEPDQVAIGPAPVQRHGTSDFPLQAVVRSGGRKVLVDDRGHIERYALESDMLERDPLLLAHEQSALQIAVDDRLHPKKLPVSDRDPIQHMIFGGFRAKRGQPGLDLVLDQPGVLGELITDEQADPFHALEDRARRALESAHNRDAPTEEGLSNEVRESLEARGYLQ